MSSGRGLVGTTLIVGLSLAAAQRSPIPNDSNYNYLALTAAGGACLLCCVVALCVAGCRKLRRQINARQIAQVQAIEPPSAPIQLRVLSNDASIPQQSIFPPVATLVSEVPDGTQVVNVERIDSPKISIPISMP